MKIKKKSEWCALHTMHMILKKSKLDFFANFTKLRIFASSKQGCGSGCYVGAGIRKGSDPVLNWPHTDSKSF